MTEFTRRLGIHYYTVRMAGNWQFVTLSFCGTKYKIFSMK